MLKIKAGNISNLTDARYFAAIGASWLGFNFRQNSIHKLTIEDAKAIKDWVAGPEIILEFDQFDGDLVFQLTDVLQTNLIQLPIEAAKNIPENYVCICATDAKTIGNLESTRADLDLLINISSEENLNQILKNFPNAIYNFNLPNQQIQKLIETYSIKKLELKGSAEEAVGIKSYDELNDLLDWIDEKELLI